MEVFHKLYIKVVAHKMWGQSGITLSADNTRYKGIRFILCAESLTSLVGLPRVVADGVRSRAMA